MTGAKPRGAARPIRERDRYPRASLREQVGDELATLRRNPKVMLLLAFLVGGWLFLQVTSPRLVRVEDLTVGACLHVPTTSNANLTTSGQVGGAGEVEAVMAGSGADVAACDASHSHEVAAVFADPDPAGAVYPNQAALHQRHAGACEAAFASYVGHALTGSAFVVTVVVQTEVGWNEGRRAGACLVSSADGSFLTARAGGSGR